MGLFGFGKKDKVIDLSSGYAKKSEIKQEESSDSFNILGNSNSSSASDNSENLDESDPRKRILKRLMDITKKLDELSIQIYHLQQRVELLEMKTGVKSNI